MYLTTQAFKKESWYIRLVLKWENRMDHSQKEKEQRRTVFYSTVSEE